MAVRTPTEILAASNGGGVSREEFLELTHALGYDDLLAPAQGELPVDTLRDAIQFLRRPFTPGALKFKVQSAFGGQKDDKGKYLDGKPPTAGLVVPYIDARLAVERLNLVLAEKWSDEYRELARSQGGKALLECRLTVDGVTRMDVGEGVGKAAYSDAIKRSAMRFGVGVSLHAIPKLVLKVQDDRLTVRNNFKTRYMLVLTQPQEVKVRAIYEAWLEHEGIDNFGEPLDHGDALDAAGDPNDPDAPEDDGSDGEQLFEDPQPPKLTGRKISAQRAQQIAEAFHSRAPESVTPDDLKAKLEAVTAKPVSDPVEALKGLKGSQADQVEEWIGGLAG